MTFVIATNNQKKLIEFRRVLDRLGIDTISLKEAGVDIEIEETGTTFEENSLIKARAVCQITGKPTVADDSGLEVDCLDGAPGVYSARYSGENATDQSNNEKLLKALQGFDPQQKSGRYVSAISCVFPDGTEFCTRGTCEGFVGDTPKGDGGFGYDPLFYVDSQNTFAMLTPDQKDAISHRGKACALFVQKLKEFL